MSASHMKESTVEERQNQNTGGSYGMSTDSFSDALSPALVDCLEHMSVTLH